MIRSRISTWLRPWNTSRPGNKLRPTTQSASVAPSARPSFSASSEPQSSKTKLWVGDLDLRTDVDKIRTEFSRLGLTGHCRVDGQIRSSKNGSGFVFVEFLGADAESQASKAIAKLRPLFNVNYARVPGHPPPASPQLKPQARRSPAITPPRSPPLLHSTSSSAQACSPSQFTITFSREQGQRRVSPPPAEVSLSASSRQQDGATSKPRAKPTPQLYQPPQRSHAQQRSRDGGATLSPAGAELSTAAAHLSEPDTAAASATAVVSSVSSPLRGGIAPVRGGAGPTRGRGGGAAAP